MAPDPSPPPIPSATVTSDLNHPLHQQPQASICQGHVGPEGLPAAFPDALPITTVQARSRESRERDKSGPTHVPRCGLCTEARLLPGGGDTAPRDHREWLPMGRTVTSVGT